MRPYLFASILFAAAASCAAPADEPTIASDSAAIGPLGSAEIAGTIAVGERRLVDYTGTPSFRALQVDALAGDRLEVFGRTITAFTGQPPLLWITARDGMRLAGPGRGTLSYDAPTTGPVFIVLRDPTFSEGKIEIELRRRGSTPAPLFALPSWADGAHRFDLRCSLSGTAFDVPMTMIVHPPTASGRKPITFAAHSFDDDGLPEAREGYTLLTSTGSVTPTSLFAAPARWGVEMGTDPRSRVVVEGESPSRIVVHYEEATPAGWIRFASGSLMVEGDGSIELWLRRVGPSMVSCYATIAAP
ncbi:MAG: hypothetical protein KIT84_37470 [Labilithrix sp.]|nr:hypothetical protein [Labilithrix sp.]MCW5816750.1 hypothetical protein [Labilithrix sp.]